MASWPISKKMKDTLEAKTSKNAMKNAFCGVAFGVSFIGGVLVATGERECGAAPPPDHFFGNLGGPELIGCVAEAAVVKRRLPSAKQLQSSGGHSSGHGGACLPQQRRSQRHRPNSCSSFFQAFPPPEWDIPSGSGTQNCWMLREGESFFPQAFWFLPPSPPQLRTLHREG